MTVAALFVERTGCYADVPDVELWDEARDARRYEGPHAVVAHSPCARWSRLAGFCEARWGLKRRDDGGCFASALASVRRWGGVLEHPAYTDAWRAHDLNDPPFAGWGRGDMLGGWTCHVEQGRYGHPTGKATWLYAYGCGLPELDWTRSPQGELQPVRWHRGQPGDRPYISKAARVATPPAFRDELLAMARSVPR